MFRNARRVVATLVLSIIACGAGMALAEATPPVTLATSATSVAEAWAQKAGFDLLPETEQFTRLCSLAREPSGSAVLAAAREDFRKLVQIDLKEIVLARNDLKTFFERLGRRCEPAVKVHDRVAVEATIRFEHCSYVEMIERLCREYDLELFFHGRTLYLFNP